MSKPGPSPSDLCPRCDEHPRRGRGLLCNPCNSSDQAKRRHMKRAAAQKFEGKKFRQSLRGNRFLITSAQNATPVEPNFWAALQVAAKRLHAQIIVVPLRYRNPSLVREQADLEKEEWWDDAVTPYLCNQEKRINPNLILRGDVKTQPTASGPLTAFEALTGGESCIVGHPKMQLKVIAAPSGRYPKILTTTGSCTQRNFSETKAGALGRFHHFLGAIIVETRGKWFGIRQLNADRETGEFTDLDQVYSPEGAHVAPPAAGLVIGDLHARFTDLAVDRARFGKRGVVETVNPLELVFEDTFDGYSCNPHHAGDPFIAAAKAKAGFGNVRAEVEHAINFVRSRSEGRTAVIVPSNHDNFLKRWVINTDWRSSPGNAPFYLETAQAMLASVRMSAAGAEYADPFKYWVDRLKGASKITCLEVGQAHQIAGVEVGSHGDVGPNGARGTVKNLSRVGARMVTGHGHSPAIEEGHTRVGTSTPLRLEYSKAGPSNWLAADCVIYASGKRSLIFYVDGRWHL